MNSPGGGGIEVGVCARIGEWETSCYPLGRGEGAKKTDKAGPVKLSVKEAVDDET